MNRRIRTAAVVAAVAAAVLGLPATAAVVLGLPATAASAAVPVPDPTAVFPAGCATGEITAFAGKLTPDGQPDVTTSGWMRPCEGTTPADEFVIIYYGPADGVITPRQIRAFTSLAGPTPFLLHDGLRDYELRVAAMWRRLTWS